MKFAFSFVVHSKLLSNHFLSVDFFKDKLNTIHKHCVAIKLLYLAFLMIFNCIVCIFNYEGTGKLAVSFRIRFVFSLSVFPALYNAANVSVFVQIASDTRFFAFH